MLTDQNKRFGEEYIIDLHITNSAIRAKYSKKTAYSIGQRLLKNVEMQDYIQKLMKERSERTNITQDKVLKELAHLGFSNIKNYIKASTDGFIVFKDIDQISEEDARAIESIKVNVKEGKIEFKLHSKSRGLELIGRHLGMFLDKVEHSGGIKHKLSMTDLKKSIKQFKEDGS